MKLPKIKELFKSSDKKKTPTEEANIMKEKEQEKLRVEIDEVSSAFSWLSDKWKEVCMKLLAQPKYVLFRTRAELDDEEENESLNKIIKIISHWESWTKDEVATKLSTEYNVAKVLVKEKSDLLDSDSDARLEYERENNQLKNKK